MEHFFELSEKKKISFQSEICQAPNPRFITPTSCTPSTTRWTRSCTKPRPRNRDSPSLQTISLPLFFSSLLFKTFFYIPYVPQKYIVSPSIYAFCYEKVVYSNSAGSREPRIWMNSLSFSKQRKQSYKLSLEPVMRVCMC